MTREQLKIYISEAVDAMEQDDLEQLFPSSQQPDLYSIIKELVGLRGEVRKLAQSTLKLNNNIKGVLENQKEQNAKIVPMMNATNTDKQQVLDDDLKTILAQIIKQDDAMQRTKEHFQTLPDLTVWNTFQFQKQFAAWKKGYQITQSQWNQLIKSIGFYKTGLPGQQFNPEIHEAVAVKTVAGESENAILETEVVGYMYQQKLIQRAKVVVNKEQG